MNIEKYPLYNGKITLEFDTAKHIYSVNGKIVYGCTNIVGIINKPALMYWAVNQAIGNLAEALKPGVKYDEVQLKNMLEEAKKMHTKTKDAAADLGTMIHEWIEKYLKAGLSKQPLPKLPINLEMKTAIKGFLEWTKENKVKFISSERRIYSKKYKYAGTLDAEAMVNGKLAIVDFKTSNAFYPEYFLQATAYQQAREEEADKKYNGVYIVRFAKNKDTKQPLFEVKKSENFEGHLRVFLACLKIYQFQQANKKEQILNGIK